MTATLPAAVVSAEMSGHVAETMWAQDVVYLLDAYNTTTGGPLHVSDIGPFDEGRAGGSLVVGTANTGLPVMVTTYRGVTADEDTGGAFNDPDLSSGDTGWVTPVAGTGLVAGTTYPVGTAVQAWDVVKGEPVRTYMARVTVDGDPDNDVPVCEVHHALIASLPEGPRISGQGESVTLERDPGGVDWLLTKIHSQSPQVDAGWTRPGTMPDPPGLPTGDPTSSPTIVTTGQASGVSVTCTDNPFPLAMLDFHVSTDPAFTPSAATLAHSGTARTFTVTLLPDGTALDAATVYYFRVVARKGAASAPASPAVQGQVDLTQPRRMVVEEWAADRALVGRLGVGTAYIDAAEGAVFPQPDGGLIKLPSDGTAALMNVAELLVRAVSSFSGVTNFYDVVRLLGTQRLYASIPAPSQAPQVKDSWNTLKTALTGGAYADWEGLTDNGASGDSAGWVLVETVNSNTRIRVVAKTTATGGGTTQAGDLLQTVSGQAWQTKRQPVGITRLGSAYYVLAYDYSGAQSSPTYGKLIVLALDSSFALTGSWTWTPSGGGPNSRQTIGNDGTNLLLLSHGASQMWIDVRTAAGATTTSTPLGGVSTWTTTNVPAAAAQNATATGVYVGQATGPAAVGVYVAWSWPNVGLRRWNLDGSTDGARTHPSPGGAPIRGLCWDGTRFNTVDINARITRMTTQGVTVSALSWAYAWADMDTGGTGTHQTALSPATAWSWKPGAQIVVAGQPAPDVNATTGNDLANRLRIFAGDPAGATSGWYLQAAPAVGQTGATLNVLNLSGDQVSTIAAAFPTSAAPGRWETSAVDGGGVPYAFAEGAGTGRMGPLKFAQGDARNSAGYRSTGSTSVASATWVQLPLSGAVAWARDVTKADDGTGGTTAGDITIPEAGLWLLIASCDFAAVSGATTASTRRLRIESYTAGQALGSGTRIGNVEFPAVADIARPNLIEMETLAANVKLRLIAYQASGSSVNVTLHRFSLQKIG